MKKIIPFHRCILQVHVFISIHIEQSPDIILDFGLGAYLSYECRANITHFVQMPRMPQMPRMWRIIMNHGRTQSCECASNVWMPIKKISNAWETFTNSYKPLDSESINRYSHFSEASVNQGEHWLLAESELESIFRKIRHFRMGRYANQKSNLDVVG